MSQREVTFEIEDNNKLPPLWEDIGLVALCVSVLMFGIFVLSLLG